MNNIKGKEEIGVKKIAYTLNGDYNLCNTRQELNKISFSTFIIGKEKLLTDL